jgi:heat shock protein 4
MSNFLLLQVAGPIEMRYKDWTESGPALELLVYCIQSFREAALFGDQKFDHIDVSEK